MKYIVIGATGYIGSYLFEHLKKDGYDVIGTSRKCRNTDEIIYYDIQKNDIRTIISDIHDKNITAIICIAETNIDRCYEYYEQAYDINVRKTKKLIHELSREGIHSIFFSSDNVFDGERGNYTEESPTHAVNQYGKMKEEMEQYLLANELNSCVLRISKTVSLKEEKQNIFTEWANQVKSGTNRCIRGNIISFTYMDDIYQACLLASQKQLHGLYNIVADRAYSRAELAGKFYDELGVQVHIQECELGDFPFKDTRPLNIGMSNGKFKRETGYQFVDMDSVIQMYISNLKSNKIGE